jgi:hypothetical protein
MGLLDKAKQQAQELKGKVEGKVEDVQQKRKVSDLLEELGRLVYAQRSDRAAPAEEIDRVISELRTLEDQGAVVVSEPSAPPADGASGDSGEPSAPPADGTSGDSGS